MKKKETLKLETNRLIGAYIISTLSNCRYRFDFSWLVQSLEKLEHAYVAFEWIQTHSLQSMNRPRDQLIALLLFRAPNDKFNWHNTCCNKGTTNKNKLHSYFIHQFNINIHIVAILSENTAHKYYADKLNGVLLTNTMRSIQFSMGVFF